jgi:hypothetical protein
VDDREVDAAGEGDSVAGSAVHAVLSTAAVKRVQFHACTSSRVAASPEFS